MIDLHTHSTASDGTLSPQALVDLAAKKGLSALALTDHDTVAGVPAALARGAERGIEVIPGVELAAQWDGGGAMHILGYYLRPNHPRLRQRLSHLRLQRRRRAREMVARLEALGLKVTFARIEEIAQGDSIGRPHVARALLEAGAIGSFREAFERYLKRGRPAYVPRMSPTPDEVIGLLKSAGGVAVLAHPSTLRVGREHLSRCVEELKSQGLEGIEVFWSGHNRRQMEAYAGLAQRLGLLPTGGSDFHGENKPDIQLGSGLKGNVQVPDSVLSALRKRHQARAAARGG